MEKITLESVDQSGASLPVVARETGKSCLSLKRLDGIDLAVPEWILSGSLAVMAQRHPD